MLSPPPGYNVLGPQQRGVHGQYATVLVYGQALAFWS